MKNLKQIWLLSALAFGVFLLFGCGGDDDVVEPSEPPPPPINVFGAPASLVSDLGVPDSSYLGVGMLLFWTDADSGLTGSYNIYRKIDAAAAVKLNTAWIVASPFGPEDYHPDALWFADTTYDTASGSTYRYYITAVSGDGESAHSDTVMCVPNTIDRNNSIANLWPADMSEISLNPTFSWDAKAGAASYLLMLANDQDHNSYWPWWLHRGTATEFAFKTAPGVTYLDAAENSLFEANEYSWILWAVNADNCGFATSMADFVAADPDFSLLFVNGSMDAGRYRLCWDQTDLGGLQVAPGTYSVHMTSGAFDTSIAFDILASGGTNPDALDCNEDFGDLLPVSFTINLNRENYLMGDTVKITYDMRDTAMVQVKIER